ncbi:MAG: hypothetical protein AB7N99_06865 [Simkaniaceae bacterium]
MKFLVEKKNEDRHFHLIYEEEGCSFNIEPFPKNIGFTSILIDFLQLEIDCENRVVYAWGYEPLMKYEETNNFPKFYEHKDIIAIFDQMPTPGVSIRLLKNIECPDNIEWPTYINKKIGLVCIVDHTIQDKRLIEFAPDCVAALDHENEMVAIWLHPRELPSRIYETSMNLPN